MPVRCHKREMKKQVIPKDGKIFCITSHTKQMGDEKTKIPNYAIIIHITTHNVRDEEKIKGESKK